MKIKIIISALFCLISFNTIAISKNDMITGEGVVYRVIDGDTYIVNVNSKSKYYELKGQAKTKNEQQHFNDKYQAFKIRLGNIDTAESTHYDPSRNTQIGVTTSSYVKKKLNGQKIAFTCWDFGKYGRAICSVRLGGKDLGLHLLKQGFSSYYTSFGTHPYLDDEYTRANR